MTGNPIHIIGMGAEGSASLTPANLALIENADWIFGSIRLIESLTIKYNQHKFDLYRDFQENINKIDAFYSSKKIVILASGDPGFFGIARTILHNFPDVSILIHPNITSFQIAFARLKMDWQDTAFTSVHAKDPSHLIGLARRHSKIAVLTDPQHTPAWVAECLLEAGIPDCRAVVAENLGLLNERIIDSTLASIKEADFTQLNILILLQDKTWNPQAIIPDHYDLDFQHMPGQLTKKDIRMLALSRLHLHESSIIWDIGAGSGAMSIDMAGISWRGHVYAIEKDPESIHLIDANVKHFCVSNVSIIQGLAPEILKDLPKPHAIFIGGSAGKLSEILKYIHDSAIPDCRVVLNIVLLDHVNQAWQTFQTYSWKPELIQANIHTAESLGNSFRLVPQNPVFVMAGSLPG